MPDIKPAKRVLDRPTYKQTIFKEIKLVMRLAWALVSSQLFHRSFFALTDLQRSVEDVIVSVRQI